MPCFHPREAFKSAEGGRVSFHEKRGFDIRLVLSCGQCIGCRMANRGAWVVRSYLEHLATGRLSSFVTFTYDDEHLPQFGSVRPKDRTLLMRRLYKHLRRFYPGVKLRYYGCDEYGDETHRPHYHVLFFGFFPRDAERIGGSSGYWISRELTDLWGLGHVSVGVVDLPAINYVASHNVDKLTGDAARKAYSRLDASTGEIVSVLPPRAFMSRNPGIGAPFLDRFLCDVTHWDEDFVIVRGERMPIPKFLADRIAQVCPQLASDRETTRQLEGLTPTAVFERTPERLAVRESVAKAKLSFRSLNRRGGL